MGNGRVWLFRFLVLALGALLVVTWFMPWWLCHVESNEAGTHDVIIHPYGLDGGGLEGYFALMPKGGAEVELPGFLIPLMWVYLGLVILALLIAMILKNRSLRLFGKEFNISRWLLGIVGLSYIAVCVIALLFAKSKVTAIGIPFTGQESGVNIGKFAMWDVYIDADSSLQIGYYLAYAAGGGLLLLALLRNKIIGNV